MTFFSCENTQSKKENNPSQKRLKNQNLKNINKQMNQRKMKLNSKGGNSLIMSIPNILTLNF